MKYDAYTTAVICLIFVGMPTTLLGVWQEESKDRSKRLIEVPTESVVLETVATDGGEVLIPIQNVGADLRKGMIESTTIALVQNSTANPGLPNPSKSKQDRVEPGLVHWHPDFESACFASQKSNKPVLLFQMMGKLDERFC